MSDLERYAKIDTVMPREFVLLKGTGCRWKKCKFCDYYIDNSSNPFSVNREVLSKVSGVYGVLDVINSGSAIELDDDTIKEIRRVADNKNIHTLWFECHWMYHSQLDKFASNFPNQKVKFRCGAETFDKDVRNSWNKGIPDDIGAKEIAKYFSGICLLVGVEGQTKQEILDDLKFAKQYFEYYSVNLFVENTTGLKRDNELAQWFINEIAPSLRKEKGCEVLIDNTDLGVG